MGYMTPKPHMSGWLPPDCAGTSDNMSTKAVSETVDTSAAQLADHSGVAVSQVQPISVPTTWPAGRRTTGRLPVLRAACVSLQREQARQERLERERRQQEADRLAKQEAQRIAKEQLREKARVAKEKAEMVPVCLICSQCSSAEAACNILC
jgi:methylthioribose-1-phosphate isomerase